MAPLDRWFIRTIEDEKGLYRQCEESEEAVVEGTESRVLSFLTGLYLELPYGYVNSDAKRATSLLEVLDG